MKNLKELLKEVDNLITKQKLDYQTEVSHRVSSKTDSISIAVFENDDFLECFLFISESTCERAFLRFKFELEMKLLK